MKKPLLACLLAALLCSCSLAEAAKAPEYTLSVKNNTVLQDAADRSLAVTSAETHAVIAGESPITGLAWDGTYLPVLVQVANDVGNGEANGYTVKSAGIGNRTPWGIQYADILYEELLSVTGYTRFAVLFSDSFTQGEPAGGVGPVRSCRIGSLLLRQEWQSGLVYGGDFAGDTWERLLWETQAKESGAVLNTYDANYDLVSRLKGVKAPDNFNNDVTGLRERIPDTYTSTPHPFLFKDTALYTNGYAAADTINLDWGYKYQISHFTYDAETGLYSRWCGAGINPKRWVLFAAFPTAENRNAADKIPLAFSNVIVQRVDYEFENGSAIKPIPNTIGQGNADIFIDGHYIAGYWVRETIDAQTVFYDDQGNELRLSRGKTFIAHFPNEARLTFTAGE